MNENNVSKRKDWIKNAAIIFLALMLILTFFSNTIMNYSLPEVATQYVQSGTITAKIRGTGNVEATDPYKVMVKESRVISSVAVKQGDDVEKDQVLYYLEDSESEELKKAKDELEDLELAYMKGLFGTNVSADIIGKVASGNTDSFDSYKAKVADMQARIKAAEDRVKECQNNVDALTLDGTIKSNNESVSTAADELEKALASADLTKAQTAFDNWKSKKQAELEEEKRELTNRISDLEEWLDHADNVDGSVGTVDTSLETVREKLEQIRAAAETGGKAPGVTQEAVKQAVDINTLDALFAKISEVLKGASEYDTLKTEYQLLSQQYKNAVADLKSTKDDVNSYAYNKQKLESKKKELREVENSIAELQATAADSNEGIRDAKNRVDQATRNITEITSANTQADVARKNQIENASAALKTAQAVLELLKAEQTTLASDINAELDLSKTNKDIEEKKEEIAKLEEKSVGAAIVAPVAGKVTNLAYVAGETTKPEETVAVIQVAGKGFTVSFSVTNDQAKKVKVGDMADFQNAWYYDGAKAMLSSIKPDPDSAGQKKLLIFDVSGENIEAGQSISLSVGQKSAEYDLTVPNSAIREDNNGKFILIVESKSGPISNRYIATRVDVEVLASDDNNSAISAGLYGYEYVITTSTKPVEAGKQVRLSNN